MLGRRVAFVVALIATVAFSGGAAVGATHQSRHQLQSPKLLPMKQQATNWHVAHHYCHKDGSTSASL